MAAIVLERVVSCRMSFGRFSPSLLRMPRSYQTASVAAACWSGRSTQIATQGRWYSATLRRGISGVTLSSAAPAAAAGAATNPAAARKGRARMGRLVNG